MYLFETAFQKDFDFFERVYDTDLKRSIVRKIDSPYEWFEESSNGDYKSITDNSKKFVRKQGSSKQSRGQAGVFDPIQRTIRDNYWKKAYNKDPRIFYADIETRVGQHGFTGFPKPELANQEISLIQIFDNVSKTMFVFGERPWKFENQYKFDFNVKYILCSNENNIIDGFLALFKQLDPLIVYAWNGNGFDFPYIFNRMKNLGMDTNRLSNHGKVSLKEVSSGYKKAWKIESTGHHFIDLLEVYKKFSFGEKASYALDNIAFVELGKKKVQHTEFERFDDFYTGKYIHPVNPTPEQLQSNIYKASAAWIETKDEKYLNLVKELSHSEFVYYGAVDAYLIKEIDKKINFTSLMVILAEDSGILLSDTLGTVKPWSQFIANTGYKNKEIIESNERSSEEIQIKGGRVTDPTIGLHEWIVSVDVNSMYPNTGMRAFNMSPEKYIPVYALPPKLKEYVIRYFNDEDEDRRIQIPRDILDKVSAELREHNLCLGINGAVFKADSTGMVPNLIKEIYAKRKKAKQTQFEYEKKKIMIKALLKEKE
jgi:DNA polymerase elongation subunit (family B)